MAKPETAFLLGVPRSGTTLLSLLLNQHPAVHCPPESWLLLALETLGQAPPDHPADSPWLSRAVTECLASERISLMKAAAESIYGAMLRRAGKALLVDKTPRYYLCLDLLEALFPESKGILLLRNPLDVAASYLTSWDINLPRIIQDKTDSPVLFDYLLGFRRLLAFRLRHPVLSLHYETLVRSPEREMAAAFDYLGVGGDGVLTEIDPELAGHAQSSLGDKKILNSPVVHADSIGSHRQVFGADDVALLLGALGKEVFAALGYEQAWAEAIEHYALQRIPDDGDELARLAEGFVAARRASCQRAENAAFYHQRLEEAAADRSAALVRRLEQMRADRGRLHRRVRRLVTENADLAARLAQASAEAARLGGRVSALENMNVRDRLTGLVDYSKRVFKDRLYRALWSKVNGTRLKALPRITMVTPVLNGEAHIAETLESVLRQDYPDLEYIIVDGGSSDRTLEIIDSYRARDDLPQHITRVISGPDNGMYDAIAKGFEQASGEIFCYLNADDLLECGSLRSVGEYFAAHPAEQLIYHEDVVLVDGWKYPNIRQPKNVDTVDLLAGHVLFQDGVFWRREAYQAAGGMRRDLKLAGDFDLWLRLSARGRLVRRPGHVSCFRVRSGQLSSRMEAYRTEMRQSICDFLAHAPLHRRLEWRLRMPLRRLLRKLAGKHRGDRLYFPIDFANMPPPAVAAPPMAAGVPCSPIDGRPAERLLFSTPDTRFGEGEINYIYLDTRHGIAITHPPIRPDKLDALYRKHYSAPPKEIAPPEGASPYRAFNGRPLWEKPLRLLPAERLYRFLRDPWGDQTFDELIRVLRAAGIDTAKPLRFLDAGCFEGLLLDRIRQATSWMAFGLEPNGNAVATARSKGHTVWQGHAEEAAEAIPDGLQFDVIFMGQTIEHMDDPVRALRRLRLLLAPGAVLVMSTPNLDSREIDYFGPTWAHWHAPYHRYIFSRNGLCALLRQVGLVAVYFRSFSHPYWTAMSIAQNRLGLGGNVSHEIGFATIFSLRACRDHFWKALLWNRLGKGDYCFMAAKEIAGD